METQVKTAPAVLVTPFIRDLTPDKEGLMPQYTRDPADDGRETRAAKLREQLDLHVRALLDLPPQSPAKYHAYGVIEGLRYAISLEESRS